MHLLFVYPSPGIWGGIETQIVRMSHWLVSHGHQVTVLTTSDRHWGELLPPGVRCVALGEEFWRLQYYFRAKRIWRRLNVPRPDVIKSFNWELHTAWIAYQLAVITGAKAVAGFYGPCQHLRDQPLDFYLRSFLRNTPARARVFMSPEQIEYLEERHGQGGELWLLPVDSRLFLPAVRRPIRGRIVSIGRLGDMKGYNLYMIQVVDELIRRGHQVTWTVHGTGEYEAEMRKIIQARKLEGVITLAGPMPYKQCRRMLAEAYVFVGMGTSIVEASLFGVPNVLALAYDHAGMTYGPLYRLPLGSVGDVRRESPTLKVVDEIERILKLSPAEYAQEAERVYQYAQPYESEMSMRRFVEIMEAAPWPQQRFGPILENYLLGVRRRLVRCLRKWRGSKS
jgi:Glycosyltransferase